MKAGFLVGVRRLEVREVAPPAVPADGLLLAVEACGVCGSDLRRWREGPASGAESVPGQPGIIAGHEIAGTVISVGVRASGYAEGDRLAVAPDIHCGVCYYCRRGMVNLCDALHFLGISPGYPGGFAERIALSGEVLARGIVNRIPEDVNSVHAALAEPMSSVLSCHRKAQTSLSDTVVIIGAGPIGCLHAAIARARGARVILSEPSDTRRQAAMSMRPDGIINPVEEDFVDRVLQLTSGLGADIVICANPVAATQADAVRAVRRGGRVVLFGGLPKANPITNLDSNIIHYGEIEVVGAFSYRPTMHELALDMLSRSLIPADHLITHKFALEDIGDAFETADRGEGLKIMVTPQGRE